MRGYARIPSTLCLLIALGIPACRTPEVVPEAPEGPVEPEVAEKDPYALIARLEDSGTDGGGRLESLMIHPSARVRERAALALGRLDRTDVDAPARRALVGALDDPSARVRATAAFSLGVRGDEAAAKALLKALRDAEESVRAAAVEALGRLEDPRGRAELLYSAFRATEPSALVRARAAVAPHAWDPEAPDAAEVDQALIHVALQAPLALFDQDLRPPARFSEDDEPEELDVVSMALYALARRKSESARDAFFLWARTREQGDVRLFAIQGLAVHPPDAATKELLRSLLGDPDWRVVVEAVRALGRHPDPAVLGDLQQALSNPSTHVRREVAAALAEFREQRSICEPILERLYVDPSRSVHAQAIESRVRLFGQEAAADLQILAFDPDPVIRAAVARAAVHLDTRSALELLDSLARDRRPQVGVEATAMMGQFLGAGARRRLHILLSSDDGGIRLAALTALSEQPSEEDLALLEWTWGSARGEIATEIRMAVLHLAAEIGGERGAALLLRGSASDQAYLRRLARRLLAEDFPGTKVPDAGPLPYAARDLPLPPEEGVALPLVEVRTSRGLMLFELYPDAAPRHVHNFLALVREDHYDGLRFHRVVPDFVIQGGDPRGDGNGSLTWDGRPLRREFNLHRYARGSLGMPRNEDPDSGGCQFFVTHRATPRLDGAYTLFGQLVQGFDVLDAIEVGDTLLGVRTRGAR